MPDIAQKTNRSLLHVFFFVKKYLLVLIIGLSLYSAFILSRQGLAFLNRFKVKPVDLLSFFGTSKDVLDSQAGVTNFLILGLRGEGSDSPNLTDSIIFFSVNNISNQVTQIGIPRDLWVPSLQAKINTAYHYGEEASSGSGIKLAETSVLEILGQPVNYTIVVNFNLFKQLIDLVGGVDILVSPGFEDNQFPIPGKETALPISSRFETVKFSEGLNHFDGDVALKFVRSRHATGDEGTDFARSVRQQQIISALKSKIFDKDFLLDKNKLDGLLNLAETNLESNIPSSVYPILARIGLEQSQKEIKVVNLNTLPDKDGVTILYNPPTYKFKGQWVIMPKDDNWKALKQYLNSHLAD